MDFESYVDALRRTGVIPVIKLENEEDAVPLANACGKAAFTPRK